MFVDHNMPPLSFSDQHPSYNGWVGEKEINRKEEVKADVQLWLSCAFFATITEDVNWFQFNLSEMT